MAQKPKKTVNTRPVADNPSTSGNIRIGGDVGGTGNVIGNQSQSNVSIEKTTPANGNRLIARIVALIIGLAGVLGVVALFNRVATGLDALSVFGLVLAALAAVLGTIGVIKPEGVVEILGKLSGKR